MVEQFHPKYVRAAGITKPMSPHSMRHTAGINTAMNGSASAVIRSDPKTIMGYKRRAEALTTET